MKSSPKWIDPGAEYPWLIPAPEEPPRHDPPDRQQLDLIEALAKLSK
jgi:hypothetical protein